MTNRRPPLPPEEAEALSGEILDRAIERAGVTNAQVALAIGHAESGERHVREMRAGARAFTMEQAPAADGKGCGKGGERVNDYASPSSAPRQIHARASGL